MLSRLIHTGLCARGISGYLCVYKLGYAFQGLWVISIYTRLDCVSVDDLLTHSNPLHPTTPICDLSGRGEGHHLCYNIVDNGTRHNTSRINILTRGNYICRLWWFIFWYTHLSIWIMCVCYTFQRAGESNSSELHFVLWEFFKILKYSFYVAII